MEGEARVDLTPYRGRPAEFTLNPDGLAPSHTFVALIPTDGEVNSVDLVPVDRSTLEPLSGEEALTAAEILAQASASASDARGYVVASREYAQEASSAASGASSSASEASSSAITVRDASLASQRASQDSADHASRAAASAGLAASSAQGVEDDRLAAEKAAQLSLASRDSASASAEQAAQSASTSSGHAEAAANSADEAARHADSAGKADASARSARDEAQASASQLNADALEFGDRVRSGEFKGDEGPANVLSIGTVSTLPPGAEATAAIVGESPSQVLNLGLVQGPEGKASTVPGPPGAVPTAADYLVVGPGRPDQPATTNGAITGREPVGARYESVDEAGVGARTWRKVAGNKWVITDGDTGWRGMLDATTGLFFNVRRTPNQVEYQGGYLFTGGGTRPANGSTYDALVLPPGFMPHTPTQARTRSIASLSGTIRSRADQDSAVGLGVLYVNTDNGDSRSHGKVVFKTSAQGFGSSPTLTAAPADPWPSFPLPGTPA